MECFAIFLALLTVAIIVIYAAIRSTDYYFSKKEDARHCKMTKAYIRCYSDGMKQMAKETVHTINDRLFEMAKENEGQ